MPPKKRTKLKPLPGFEKKGYLNTNAAWVTVHDLKTKGYSNKDISELCNCALPTVRYTLVAQPPSVRKRKSPVSPAKKKEQQKRRRKIKSVLGRKKKMEFRGTIPVVVCVLRCGRSIPVRQARCFVTCTRWTSPTPSGR